MPDIQFARIKSYIWGNKPFLITWTFIQHKSDGLIPKKFPGIDIGTPRGVNLYTPEYWVCYHSYRDVSGSEIVTLYHPHTRKFTQYVHLQNRFIKVGDRGKKGFLFARSGASGTKDLAGKEHPHTHIALLIGTVYKYAVRINPYSWLISITAPATTNVIKTPPPATSKPKLMILATNIGKVTFWTTRIKILEIQRSLQASIKLGWIKGVGKKVIIKVKRVIK